jgi:uncharacterized protein (TIGR03085 family)
VTSIAAHERMLLCALAQQLGPDQPTLCGDWTVRDLVAHLLVREGSPAAVGIAVPPLAGLTEHAMQREARHDFHAMVTRLRHGPPIWSPMRLPKIGPMLNTMEFFVHHEDIRRAQPGWEPRLLPAGVEDVVWRGATVAGKGFTRSAPVAVTLQRSDTVERARLSGGDGEVLVRGLPAELAMFVYGRQGHARVDLEGDDAAVAALQETDLGI